MLKGIVLVASCAAAAFAGGSVPRTVYSAPQISLPIGASFKVTPDPANIWSWNESLTGSGSPHSSQVLVDMNGDGRMDTTDPHVRVLITDAQIWPAGEAIIRDDSGNRWRLEAWLGSDGSTEVHFSTPIVLPIGSQLWVDSFFNNSPGFHIHLIGRVVNL